MQADRLQRLTDLWSQLVTLSGDVLGQPAALRILAQLRREHDGAEDDAAALGFGKGYATGHDAGYTEGYDAGHEAGRLDAAADLTAQYLELAPDAARHRASALRQDSTPTEPPTEPAAMLDLLDADLAAGKTRPH
jgi:hypothetical protein